ncbi:MAG: hypothetical protein Q9217_001456 [Psora testacea]
MTSISQPIIPPQAPNNASQVVAPSPSSSASASSKPPSQAAGSASAKGSYANATKKTFSPPSASGTSSPAGAALAQHGKLDTSSPVNGRIAIPPAVPAVGSPTIVNGNTPTSSTSGLGDHSRKPSVTISAAGAPGHMPNGAAVAGKPAGGNGIQFGAMKADGSPAAANASKQPPQSLESLAVNAPSNPRATSPQTSPSPIPQPPASGGKPPSTLHGHGNSLSFGNFGGAEGNVSVLYFLSLRFLNPYWLQMRSSSISQAPLMPGPQTSHLRRESSHSQHSDMSNHGMGSGVGRGGYPQHGGRGRGYGAPYHQQMPYPPSPNFRQTPNQPRNGANMTTFQQQNRPYPPYPNSPHQQPASPMPSNARTVHPQPGQMQMQTPPIGQSQYGGYPNQPYGYPPNLGTQQVKPFSPLLKGHPSRKDLKKDDCPSFLSNPRLDLSPHTGNFEHFLTAKFPQMGYPMPQQQMDPNFVAQWYHMYGHPPPPSMAPPQSPRPPNQYPPGPQTTFQGQYGQQPPPMSRTSSTISGNDRPASSMGKSQASTTPAPNQASNSSRTSSTPAPPTNNFQKPKKSAGIVIKDPTSGEVVDLKHSASPAPSSKSTNSISAAPTPPPRAPSQPDASHTRTESKVAKTEGKDLREQLARQIKEKEEADAKAAQDRKDTEVKLQNEKDEADAKQLEAAKAQIDAEEAEKKNRAEAEEVDRAAAKAQEAADTAVKGSIDTPEIDEDEIARWEAEAAEEERKAAEREAAYLKKKQAEKDEAARKEAEAFKMADEEMKRGEREAEEAEKARLQEKEKESQKEIAAEDVALQTAHADTASIATAIADDTPVDSGVPPPERKASASAGKQKPAALLIETTKPVEPPKPSAALMSLRSARKIAHLSDVSYPKGIIPPSPNPAINKAAPAQGKFIYDRDFLLQFKNAFTDKPSENWSDKVKETVGDTGEPQSARGTPRTSGGGSMMSGRQPSNRGPPIQQQMGTFGQSTRTLPPGTSSEQRFQASTRGLPVAGRQMMQNPLASLVSRPSAFPQPSSSIKLDRTPSSTSLNHPSSPRNASQRGGSQRGSRAARREDPKDNKTMPLTAGANVKPIEVSSTGWKPRSVGAAAMAGPAPGGDGHMAPDVVQRKVKSNLNKMTPNNFDKISNQILAIAHQSKDETDGRSLRQVIQLTFEKATDEAHWAEMYAQFCKRMLDSMSPEIKDENILDKRGEVVVGGALFRKYLLNRCQTEFERGWKMNLPEKPEGETEEAAMLSDDYYIAAAAKRRGLGLVRFIGELYKLQMLTERIMHECVKKLVDHEGIPDEAEVESLTSLLKTIGQQLDSSEKGHSMMDAYFQRIKGMIELRDLPSRLRFMLMDVVDLRAKNRWQPRGAAVNGPTTLDEVRAQAAEAERQKEVQRIQESSRRGGGGGSRPPLGRGDVRNFSAGGMMPPPDYQRNHVDVGDLRRLGSKNASRQASATGPSFAPPSMFANPRGSNSRRPLNMGGSANDSGASSRVGTPPAQKEKKDKEKEEAAKSGANVFSILATADASEPVDAASPGSSPALSKALPAVAEMAKGKELGETPSKPSEEL